MKYKNYDELQAELYPILMNFCEHREYMTFSMARHQKKMLGKDIKMHTDIFMRQNKLAYKKAKRIFKQNRKAELKALKKELKHNANGFEL